MRSHFLALPLVKFWHAVLLNIHEERHGAELMQYAEDTIFKEARESGGPETAREINYLKTRADLASTENWSHVAWNLCYWFVYSGRSEMIFDGTPNSLSMFEIDADGVKLRKGRMPRRRNSAKWTSPPNEQRREDDCPF